MFFIDLGSTSNLLEHLRRIHPQALSKLLSDEDESQPSCSQKTIQESLLVAFNQKTLDD